MRCSFRTMLALAVPALLTILALAESPPEYRLRVDIQPRIQHLGVMLVGISTEYAVDRTTGSADPIRFSELAPGNYLLEIELANGMHLQRTVDLLPDRLGRQRELRITLKAADARFFPDASSQRVDISAMQLLQSPGVSSAIENAWKMLAEGRLSEAHCSLRNLVEAHPNSADAWISLGAIAGRMGYSDAAIRFFGEAIALNPDSFRAYLNLSEALERAGQTRDAMYPALRAVELRPNDLLARLHIAALHLRERSYQAAAGHLMRALELDSPEADVTRLQLGVCFAELGDLDAALREFTVWLERHPGHPRYANITGVCEEIRHSARQASSQGEAP